MACDPLREVWQTRRIIYGLTGLQVLFLDLNYDSNPKLVTIRRGLKILLSVLGYFLET
jgi:hypothetical protein